MFYKLVVFYDIPEKRNQMKTMIHPKLLLSAVEKEISTCLSKYTSCITYIYKGSPMVYGLILFIFAKAQG